MKKISTLFKREFEGHNIAKIYPEVTEGIVKARTEITYMLR